MTLCFITFVLSLRLFWCECGIANKQKQIITTKRLDCPKTEVKHYFHLRKAFVVHNCIIPANKTNFSSSSVCEEHQIASR